MNAGNEKRLTSVRLLMLKPWDLMMVHNAVWILRALWLVKKKKALFYHRIRHRKSCFIVLCLYKMAINFG